MIDSPIETQDLSKDEDQDHADEDAALGHVGTHALVTYDTDAVTGRETCHANRYTASEMHKATEQAVVRFRVEILGDQDGDDEGVDSDDTRHDDGDEALGTRATVSWLERKDQDLGNGPQLTFMIKSGLKVPTPAMPMPDLAVPYAAPAHPNIMAAAIPPCT